MSDKIINFNPGGGGKPPGNYSAEQVAEVLYQLDKSKDTINHLSMVIETMKEERKRLIGFITEYDQFLTTLLDGHVQQAKNASATAKQLEAIRKQILSK